MTSITIPTTSTTQTLTGDNGEVTSATFTANELTGANFGGDGVGLAGANYDPSGEAALVVDFSRAVEDFQFTLFDVDQNGTSWDDQIRVEAYDLDGNPIAITFSTNGTGHVVEENGAAGVLQIEASNANTGGDDQSSIIVNVAGPVGSVRIFYEDGTSATNNGGIIDLIDMSFTDVVGPDGTVSGTSGDDLINAAYVGDPHDDRVDNNDAILPGAASNDDLIEAGDGNDTIFSGAGADNVFAGDGNDTVFGGAGADVVIGGTGNDTIDGDGGNDLLIGDQDATDSGQDSISGGAGNDTIYGDTAPADALETIAPTVFSWANQSPADEADISAGLTGTTTDGNITVSLSTNQEANFTSVTMEKNDALFDFNGVSESSSIELLGGAAGTSQDTATLTLDFSANDAGLSDEVENVTFGIFDLDELEGQFEDQVIIRAFDADGNLIPVTLTPGNATTITTTTAADGSATATAVDGAGNVNPDSEDGFFQVSVAGPVSYIEIEYNNIDPDFGAHAIRVGDITLTSIPETPEDGDDDTLDGGIGDDTLFGQGGDDTIQASEGDDTSFGGTGDDTFNVSDDSDGETIQGGEDADSNDIDVVDFSSPTSSQGVDVSFTGDEAATFDFVGTTASGTFEEIEQVDGTAFDDTIDAGNSTVDQTLNAGAGTDTITSGEGDDTIDLGSNGGGSTDGDDDVLVLTDDFGSDVVTNFEAPTSTGNGTFSGNDTLDVTGLTDATGDPVNTDDVTVTDDGSGNAVLTFPNGESVTLDGIPSGDADNPIYLHAIGIPLAPQPDGIVTGTQGADVIDAAFDGDIEGDFVDAGDELLAGEGVDDDIIVAQGGDDSIAAGAGNDDIYGGDGADVIDGGTGDDTIYGDTPSGAWFFEYYDLDENGSPDSLAEAGFIDGDADFAGIPTEVGYTDTIAPAAIDSGDDFALKFTSILTVTTAGDYTFETSSDDGSKLFIDGVEVVTNDGTHALESVTGAPINLSAGDHVIEIIYFEDGGGNQLTASVSGPDTGGTFTDLATFDGLRAASGDDTITGGTGDDTLFGGDGSDQFNVAEADDSDTITGGEDAGGTDTDTISFAGVGSGDGVDVTFTGDEAGDYLVGATGSDGDFTEIERIVGTDNDDTVDLSGSSAGITVEAGTGDDDVISGDGDDVIATGTGQDDIQIGDDFGNDDITGGEGSDGTGDVLDGATLTQDVTVDYSGSEIGTVDNGTDTLDFAEIEAIVTGSGDDTVLGDIGDDVVTTGAGTDTISGGAGDDTFDAGSGNDIIDGGTGADSITAGTGQDDILINDSFGDDNIDGGSGADGTGDFLDGSGLTEDVTVDFSAAETGTIDNGADTLDFAEIEVIETGSGDDTVLGDVGNDVVSTGAGADTLSGGAGDDTFDAGTGNDTIDGGTGDDSITAGTGQDTILINDSFGNDTIDGGDGADGTGDVLDGSGLTEDVVVDLSAPETGTVTNGTDTTSFEEIEEIITGSGDDTVTGGTGSDTISTGAGEDEVTFSSGDDIDTGADDDLLILNTAGTPNDITIDGGDEVRDGNGDLIGNGDTLQLGDLADLSTLMTTTAADGSLSGTVELDDGSTLTFTDIERIICFTPGTTIATPKGARPIETLKVGDLVVTRDHGLQPIRWIQSRTVKAEGTFAPVRIRPGAVVGLEKDLIVSPQHRMLFSGYRSELLFGEREVLMPALHLVDNKMVTREVGGDVTYIHMMFDSHEIVYADGAASESFHPGEEGLYGITTHAREELFALFPELRSNPTGYGSAARRCLKKHEAQMLRVR